MGRGVVYSEDVVGQIEMIHILALGLHLVLLLAVQMTSFVFHSGEKSMFMIFQQGNFFQPLILTQGKLNFKNSLGSCLDYITGMLLHFLYNIFYH